MSDSSASVLGGLRNPEYTGENRCVACTVVNAVIAVAASVLVALAVPALGIVVLVMSAVLIYARGYLIPGTPELTKRYLPARVLAAFGKHPIEKRRTTETSGATDGATDPGDGADSGEPTFETVKKVRRRREQSVDPVPFLRDAGVLGPGDDDRLTDAFADRIHDRAVTHRDREIETASVAGIFGVDPGDVAERDREYPAYEIGVRIRKWPSEGALIADVAAHEALGEYADRWGEVPPEQRADILEWLRGLRNDCPVCGGAIAFSDDVIESCCGRFEVTTIACADCGERLREFDPVKVGNREALEGITP